MDWTLLWRSSAEIGKKGAPKKRGKDPRKMRCPCVCLFWHFFLIAAVSGVCFFFNKESRSPGGQPWMPERTKIGLSASDSSSKTATLKPPLGYAGGPKYCKYVGAPWSSLICCNFPWFCGWVWLVYAQYFGHPPKYPRNDWGDFPFFRVEDAWLADFVTFDHA